MTPANTKVQASMNRKVRRSAGSSCIDYENFQNVLVIIVDELE